MHKGVNIYRPIEAEVLDVITETPAIKTVTFKPKEAIDFKMGQFIEFTVPGVGEAPFTPSSRPSVKEMMQVSVMKVGRVTEMIHQLKRGDIVGVRGPFGKGYPLEAFKGKQVLIVGGGCGFAPIRSLMYEFFERSAEFKGLFFRGGCKTSKDLLYKDELKEWVGRKDLDFKVTVDVGDGEWKGNVGLVTTLLDNISIDHKNGIAVVCGPPIMMKFVTLKLLDLGFKEENIYLSMEKNMSCGVGKCGHCRMGTCYVCKDGPVFTYAQIKDFPNIWD